MVKKRRIFVGYQLSEILQYEIGQWREKFLGFPVRWTPLEFLHVTLVPPWYEEDIDKITRLLQSMPKPVRQFPVTFETVTFGPENKRPWLIWARGEMPAELFTLRAHLADVLERKRSSFAKASADEQDPILHTTLARFSKEQFEQFPEKQFSKHVRWEETITSFSLIESHLRRTGAVYEKIAKINL